MFDRFCNLLLPDTDYFSMLLLGPDAAVASTPELPYIVPMTVNCSLFTSLPFNALTAFNTTCTAYIILSWLETTV